MVDLQTVSIVLASAGVIAGVVYYIMDVQHQEKVRMTDLFMRMQETWLGEEMIGAWLKIMNLEFTDYDDFKEKYGALYAERQEHVAFLSVANHFSAIGYLLKRRMISFDAANELPIDMTWEKLRPIIEGVRVQFGAPRMYEEIEYLYHEVQRRRQQSIKTQE